MVQLAITTGGKDVGRREKHHKFVGEGGCPIMGGKIRIHLTSAVSLLGSLPHWESEEPKMRVFMYWWGGILYGDVTWCLDLTMMMVA